MQIEKLLHRNDSTISPQLILNNDSQQGFNTKQSFCEFSTEQAQVS